MLHFAEENTQLGCCFSLLLLVDDNFDEGIDSLQEFICTEKQQKQEDVCPKSLKKMSALTYTFLSLLAMTCRFPPTPDLYNRGGSDVWSQG